METSDQTLRAIFDQAAVGIAQIGLDGSWLRVNDRYCQMLGYSESELRTKTICEITHPADGPRRDWSAMYPVEGALAVDSLIQPPRRTSATVAALMRSIALVIGTGGVASANYAAIEKWAREIVDFDLVVSTSESTVRRDFHFPASMEHELEQVGGIDEIQALRVPRVPFRGRPVLLVATAYQNMGMRWRQTPVAGDPRTMYRLVADEKGLIVSENLANLQHLRLGEMLELNTPTGPLRKPVSRVRVVSTKCARCSREGLGSGH
jgi:PAS domain-containing protein